MEGLSEQTGNLATFPDPRRETSDNRRDYLNRGHMREIAKIILAETADGIKAAN